jgi:hypothetical protein
LHRIHFIAGVIGALTTMIVAFDANAFSISPVPNQSYNVTLVAGGCGLGFHPGPYGGCRPNIAGYPAVGYGGGVYRGGIYRGGVYRGGVYHRGGVSVAAACTVAAAASTAAEAAFEVVAVAADGDPILGLSTRSACSAVSTTALASIASFIMEAKKPMSELSRRRCKGLSRRRSCAVGTATCGSFTTRPG